MVGAASWNIQVLTLNKPCSKPGLTSTRRTRAARCSAVVSIDTTKVSSRIYTLTWWRFTCSAFDYPVMGYTCCHAVGKFTVALRTHAAHSTRSRSHTSMPGRTDSAMRSIPPSLTTRAALKEITDCKGKARFTLRRMLRCSAAGRNNDVSTVSPQIFTLTRANLLTPEGSTAWLSSERLRVEPAL